MIKNNLYKTSEKSYILIYQTENLAKTMVIEARKEQSKPVLSAHCLVKLLGTMSATYWSNKFNTVVHCSDPDDVICIIEKKNSPIPNTELWYCIIGEKIGWIIVDDKVDMILL